MHVLLEPHIGETKTNRTGLCRRDVFQEKPAGAADGMRRHPVSPEINTVAGLAQGGAKRFSGAASRLHTQTLEQKQKAPTEVDAFCC